MYADDDEAIDQLLEAKKHYDKEVTLAGRGDYRAIAALQAQGARQANSANLGMFGSVGYAGNLRGIFH